MSKQTVHYDLSKGTNIKIGNCAQVYPLDHPSALVSNKTLVITSEVMSYNKESGVFETQNTMYVPQDEISNE